MKKLTKEQLKNTYIVNDCPVKRNAYKLATESVGIYGASPHTFTGDEYKLLAVMSGRVARTNKLGKREQLHLSDLIELKNSKVYTKDSEVVRKYAELCGVSSRETTIHNCGYFNSKFHGVCSFMEGSNVDDSDHQYHEITVDQINALHREKFPEQYIIKNVAVETDGTEVKTANNKDVYSSMLESCLDNGMLTALQRIAKSCGKSFGVDVGYEDLPELVESIVNKPKPKPRTRVYYVKVEDSIFNLKYDFESDNLYALFDGGYRPISSERVLLNAVQSSSLYRRVEKEVDWREETLIFLESQVDNTESDREKFVPTKSEPYIINFNGHEYRLGDSELFDFCEFVAAIRPE